MIGKIIQVLFVFSMVCGGLYLVGPILYATSGFLFNPPAKTEDGKNDFKKMWKRVMLAVWILGSAVLIFYGIKAIFSR